MKGLACPLSLSLQVKLVFALWGFLPLPLSSPPSCFPISYLRSIARWCGHAVEESTLILLPCSRSWPSRVLGEGYGPAMLDCSGEHGHRSGLPLRDGQLVCCVPVFPAVDDEPHRWQSLRVAVRKNPLPP